VLTDAGLMGIGGASRYNGPAEMKQYVDAVIKPILVGKNRSMWRPHRRHLLLRRAGAWSGVDTALWDIIGKAKGVPLYKLLAVDTEPVTRIRTYASGGEYTWRKNSRFPGPDDLIRQATEHQRNGYTAFKFRPAAASEGWASPSRITSLPAQDTRRGGPSST